MEYHVRLDGGEDELHTSVGGRELAGAAVSLDSAAAYNDRAMRAVFGFCIAEYRAAYPADFIVCNVRIQP